MPRLTLANGNWLPMNYPGVSPMNIYGVSGLFLNLVAGSASMPFLWQEFNRLPSSRIYPLLPFYGIMMDSFGWANVGLLSKDILTAVGGSPPSDLTDLPQHPHCYCVLTENYGSGNCPHEWHHAIDFALAGYTGSFYSDGDSTFQAAWTRAQTFWGAAPLHQAQFYGWSNSREFWAELARCHWNGTGGGLTGLHAYDPAADSAFSQLVNGYGAGADSHTDALHAYMQSVPVPPYPASRGKAPVQSAMQAYSILPEVLPGGTSAVNNGTWTQGLQFSVTRACTLLGYWFYLPAGGTTTGSSYSGNLFTTTTGMSGTAVSNGAVTGGNPAGPLTAFTAGTWNCIPLLAPVPLGTGITYVAAVTSPQLVQTLAGYWSSGGGGGGGITTGPVHIPGQSAAVGGITSGFFSGTGFPGTNSGAWNGMDIQVAG